MGKALKNMPSLTLRNIPSKRFTGSFCRSYAASGMLVAGLFLVGITVLLASFVPAGAVTYQYDQLGRVTSADYGGGKTVTYTYDPAGNRTAQTIIANSANLIWTATVSPCTSNCWGAGLWHL